MTEYEKLTNQLESLKSECKKIRNELKTKYEGYENKSLFFYDVCINRKHYKINRIEMVECNTARKDDDIYSQVILYFEDSYLMDLKLTIGDVEIH